MQSVINLVALITAALHHTLRIKELKIYLWTQTLEEISILQ